MNDNRTKSFALPEIISFKNVSSLFSEISNISAVNKVRLDFNDVKGVDSFGIALINHLINNDENIDIENINSFLKDF